MPSSSAKQQSQAEVPRSTIANLNSSSNMIAGITTGSKAKNENVKRDSSGVVDNTGVVAYNTGVVALNTGVVAYINTGVVAYNNTGVVANTEACNEQTQKSGPAQEPGPAKEEAVVGETACLAAGEDAADEAAGSYAKAKEEAAVRKTACLAAGEDAADEAAGSLAKAKVEADVGKTSACKQASSNAGNKPPNDRKVKSMNSRERPDTHPQQLRRVLQEMTTNQYQVVSLSDHTKGSSGGRR